MSHIHPSLKFSLQLSDVHCGFHSCWFSICLGIRFDATYSLKKGLIKKTFNVGFWHKDTKNMQGNLCAQQNWSTIHVIQYIGYITWSIDCNLLNLSKLNTLNCITISNHIEWSWDKALKWAVYYLRMYHLPQWTYK